MNISKATLPPVGPASSQVEMLSRDNKENQKFSDVIGAPSQKPAREPVSTKPSSKPSVARNTEENKSEKTSSKAVTTTDEQNEIQKRTKAVTRQAAMDVFLDKMQNELGVEPVDILAAFDQLSLEDMMAPPEDTAKKLIKELQLNPAQSEKALSLYNEMLAMTAAASLSGQMVQSGTQANMQVVTQKDAKLSELRSSIGDMSDRFFMTGMHNPKTGIDQQAKIANIYSQQMGAEQNGPISLSDKTQNTEVQNSENKDGLILTPEAGWDLNVDPDTAMGAAAIGGAAAAAANEVADGEKPLEKLSFENSDSAASADPNASKQKLLSKELNPNEVLKPAAAPIAAHTVPVASNLGQAVPGLEATTSGAIVGSTGAWTSSSADSSDNEGGDSSDSAGKDGQTDNFNISAVHNQNANSALKTQNKTFILNAPQATEADVQTNVKEIISQAQYLAKKGGGEMKVSLNPDGLGEMNLKVKMVNGQVNVEMITASDEAKKVLEKGLSELKDSLATHKLHLDSIKIDSGKEISNQLNNQHQRDQDQSFQQRFLGDFRERNQSTKREMFEFGAPSVPKSQTRDQAANSVYASSGKKRAESSRRLDLVA